MSARQAIQHFSTAALPPGMRFDYWMSILSQSLWPVSEWKGIEDFTVDLKEAQLGCITAMEETIGPSEAHRTPTDVEHSGDRCYLLFANRRSWQVAHRGYDDSYAPGDCVLVDSEGELETRAPTGFSGAIIKLPVSWVQTWLPKPELLIGRKIGTDSKWGRVFSPIVAQLTPELAVAPPLAPSVLVDQVGAVLALIAGEVEVHRVSELLAKIHNCIRERCLELQLTADDVAAELRIPPRLLHRVLAGRDLTFASLLLDARTSVAVEMLGSGAAAQLTIADVARRSGFLNTSYFVRAVRKRTGHTPLELRQFAR